MSYEKKHGVLKIPVFLTMLVLILVLIPGANAQTVRIMPASQAVSLYSGGGTVSVDVEITGVTDLAGFQYDLGYTSNLLSVASAGDVTEGTFLSNSGADSTDWTSPAVSTDGMIDNAACVRLKETGVTYTGSNGNGILSNVVFQLDMIEGRADLALANVKLSDRDANSISFTTQNAYVDVQECVGSETRGCIHPVCSVSGTKTCSGGVWGACDAVCPDETCDGLDNNGDGYIDNAPGVNQHYTLTRPCSDNYQGECGVGDETCAQTTGWSGCPTPATELCNAVDEDCDGDSTECGADITDSTGGSTDGCVNLFDLIFVSSRFGLASTDAGWDARADLVDNDEIDIFDLVTIARDFGNGSGC